jgi:hypothetical protein
MIISPQKYHKSAQKVSTEIQTSPLMDEILEENNFEPDTFPYNPHD